MLLPWQMLVPNYIVADVVALADVIAIFIVLWWQMLLPQRKMFHPFIATWQMVLPYDIVVDVRTTEVACYNSCLVGVICQWQME